MQGMQVKLRYPLTMRATPERLRDASCGGAVQIDYLYIYLYLYRHRSYLLKTLRLTYMEIRRVTISVCRRHRSQVDMDELNVRQSDVCLQRRVQ